MHIVRHPGVQPNAGNGSSQPSAAFNQIQIVARTIPSAAQILKTHNVFAVIFQKVIAVPVGTTVISARSAPAAPLRTSFSVPSPPQAYSRTASPLLRSPAGHFLSMALPSSQLWSLGRVMDASQRFNRSIRCAGAIFTRRRG